MMFGRVRASSSSPDGLERPAPKLLKHDSLSVYESTLLKLRMGSQHATEAPPEEMPAENDPMDMEADGNCNSTSAVCPAEAVLVSPQPMMTVDGRITLPRSSDCHGSPSASTKASIHHLFSRYKESKAAPTSYDHMVTTDDNRPPSIPENRGQCSCLGSMDQQSEPDSIISSITVGSM